MTKKPQHVPVTLATKPNREQRRHPEGHPQRSKHDNVPRPSGKKDADE